MWLAGIGPVPWLSPAPPLAHTPSPSQLVDSRLRPSRVAALRLIDNDDAAAILTEANVEAALAGFREAAISMFGCHPQASAIGITGDVRLSHIDGPFVSIMLSGKFWHRRETVLANAGTFLRQRIPEICEVDVADPDMLIDVVTDEETGVVLEDRRAPDLSGDRATLEYQGIDPDSRGPFPRPSGGFRVGGSIFS